MYYLDNHDVNSYDRTIAEAFSPEVLPSMYSVIFTLPGVPLIYSGDEIAYDKSIAFMEKDTIDWNRTGRDYRDLIKALSELKSSHPALCSDNTGEGFEIIDTGNKNIFAYKRIAKGDEVICIFNLSKRQQEGVDLSSIFPDKGEVLFCGVSDSYGIGGELPGDTHTFEPWEFYIIGNK